MITDEIAAALNFPQAGLLVQRVTADSEVDKAGLLPGNIKVQLEGQSFLLGGDLILEINGLVCAVPHDFALVREAALSLPPDEPYAIKIFRSGEVLELVTGTQGGGILESISGH